METFRRGDSFEFQLTLKYKDTETAIDLDDVDEITVAIVNQLTDEVLLTRTLTDSDVRKVTAASGICSIYINGADTLSADKGRYDYIATVEVANSYFDDSDADFSGFGEAFILK